MSNLFRTTVVPEYLVKAAQDLKESERKERKAKFDKEQREKIKSGKVSKRWASANMDMIDHGFNVREDKRTGSIWHVDGEELIRQDTDEEIEAIIASL